MSKPTKKTKNVLTPPTYDNREQIMLGLPKWQKFAATIDSAITSRNKTLKIMAPDNLGKIACKYLQIKLIPLIAELDEKQPTDPEPGKKEPGWVGNQFYHQSRHEVLTLDLEDLGRVEWDSVEYAEYAMSLVRSIIQAEECLEALNDQASVEKNKADTSR
ncbi:uncharacterized protein MYCFIDRAFT_196692 [Pseudocercospora fijiensis CIRAD86]|uniref:Uncharacterized protein n=1 Tax=Pseudocercospora fijiensis (strain CIRAD86) TaxID=383855 RepID=M2ZWN0_PSEFD|nr:uncharacterized protein MYCFIDRAFT_196692 [Pseudocercospora fijiensis CIRAD86]EME83404.1 hypothetical protein MYCFIDRAFT_196692 [Pseudocercospora fijiensis CIRAD86]